MSKPTIFFSHASVDHAELVALKSLFVEKTGGAIDVFLSSDGESIPFGVNWVYALQQALTECKLMFVFVSPQSLRSNWLYFESGFAYSKTIRVVPLGYKGVDLATLPPPLSLLQGFNLSDAGRLDNLIALANEVFGHAHSSHFSSEEFEAVSVGHGVAPNGLGRFSAAIDHISIAVNEGALKFESRELLKEVTRVLTEAGCPHQVAGGSIEFHGVEIDVVDLSDDKFRLRCEIEPTIADVAMPIVARVLGEVKKTGLKNTRVDIAFADHVRAAVGTRLSARVYDSELTLSAQRGWDFRDMSVRIRNWSEQRGYSLGTEPAIVTPAMLLLGTQSNSLSVENMRALVDLLFDREALYFVSQAI